MDDYQIIRLSDYKVLLLQNIYDICHDKGVPPAVYD